MPKAAPDPLAGFDPNSASDGEEGIFGLPFKEENAQLVYLPVPWEVTTSYGGGTVSGPAAILKASRQVDLFDVDVLRPYEAGLAMLEERGEIRRLNDRARRDARKLIEAGGETKGDAKLEAALKRVNAAGERLNEIVYGEAKRLMAAGKIVGLVGGDHSTPLGAIRAAAERWKGLGILHFDAHLDLRIAYEGFAWSHASIMYNVLERVPAIGKLVPVGIRDFCEQEYEYAKDRSGRIEIFWDRDLNRRRFAGEPWTKTAREIAEALPKDVWVSFDIDGLDSRFCPHTGTPVPGGLDFEQANHVLGELMRSGKRIVGFDLNEVSPGRGEEWDANVGARMLYKLSAWTLASQGRAEIR